MERVKLEVRSREERGKDVRALRAAGDIPGVIYQAGVESTRSRSMRAICARR